ncbi:hypothetical protein VTN77DRAFT_5993 [Rasamsonia byssochlamydoides]|uniref:uncharacterized protein n=1 Tax=Rasamsonia byssochlamydoides TaxID=89139 RepID=UPI003743FCA8
MVVFHPSEGGKTPSWGPATATTNFCEEDYHVTAYVAEFINTLTNVGYGYYGLCGLWNNWHRRPFADFNLQYLALLFVGIGSAAFHMTLQRAGQSADQISMFLGAAAVLHRVTTFNAPSRRWSVAILLTLGLALVFWAQMTLSKPIIHWVIFAAMVAVIWRRVAYLITTVTKKTMVAKTRRMARWGFVAFVSGYCFWVVDVYCCPELRVIRRALGLPWAWIFELHGWWHVLTSVGVYHYMVLADYLHLASTSQHTQLGKTALQTPIVVESEARRT